MENPSTEETIKRRKNVLQETEDVEELGADSNKKGVQEVPERNIKYYFNRFRYYHYCLAEKLETLIGIVCMMVIKIYFFLSGYRQNDLFTGKTEDDVDIDVDA